MITVFTALRQEAWPLIERLSLKKAEGPGGDVGGGLGIKPFDIYENEGIRLVVTGIGKLPAAAVAGYLLGRYGSDGYFLNYGSAAGSPELIGKSFLAAKVEEASSGSCYFPDIADEGFPHISLVTCDRPVRLLEGAEALGGDGRLYESGLIYDMEAFGLISALRMALTPDRIIVLKTVTDSGGSSGREICDLLLGEADRVAAFIATLSREEDGGQEGQAKGLLLELGQALHCSRTMEARLAQLITYAETSGGWEELGLYLQRLREEGRIPAKDRRCGKEVLKALSRSITGMGEDGFP